MLRATTINSEKKEIISQITNVATETLEARMFETCALSFQFIGYTSMQPNTPVLQ